MVTPSCIISIMYHAHKISSHVLFLDLAKDSKTLDINEIINLDTSKLKVEETSEHIVRKIQDWLATESHSQQVASLPEDTTQCLLVGVSMIYLYNFLNLFISTYAILDIRKQIPFLLQSFSRHAIN